jgi:MscS family membrane protein
MPFLRSTGPGGRTAFGLIAASSLLIGAAPAAAQLPAAGTDAAAGAELEAPVDPYGRATPAGAVAGFVAAIAEGDHALAGRYLDLSNVPERRRAAAGARAAAQLEAALDRAGQFVPRPRLSEEAEGDVLDGLAPDREQVGTIGAGAEAAPILLERQEGETGPYWVIASETLAAAVPAVSAAPAPLAERWLPGTLTDLEIRGAPASHWLAILGAAAAAFAAFWLLFRLLGHAVCRLGQRGERARKLVRVFAPPLALLGAIIVGSTIGPVLGASIVARQGTGRLFEIAGWLAFGWLGWRIMDAASDRVLDRLSHKGRLNATAIVQFAARLMKLAIVVLTFMAILDAIGFDVTTAVAALGIGGLAIALGAQKTVENLIASLSILSDRPFRIGETCRFGDTTGTVEDIGMRSSRIRTLDGTLLTIPNSSLSNTEIENLSRRSKGWFHPMLHLDAGTPPDRIEALLSALRETLSDERLDGGQARVRLLAPTPDRLPIEIFGYIRTRDFDEYLAIQEELLLGVLKTVARHGLRLAPPVVQVAGGPAAAAAWSLAKAG